MATHAPSVLRMRGNWMARRGKEPIYEQVEVELTSAQVKALRATPIEIFPAPGAGLIAEFVEGSALLDYGGTNVFTESADNLAMKYVDGSGVAVSETIETTGFIDQSGDMKTNIISKKDIICTKAQCENKAIVLHNTGDGEIAGNAGADNKLRIKATIKIIVSGW